MALYPNAKGGYWEYGTAGYPIVGGLSENVLDDFEDGSLSEYGGARSKYEVQKQDVIKGRYTLKGTGDGAVIGDNGGDIPTPRSENATEYRSRMYFQGGGGGTILTNVQSEGSPWTNCYGLVAHAGFNEIGLFRREKGSTEYLEIKSVRIDAEKEYWPFITLTTEGINGGIRNAEGTELTRTDSYRDVTFSGGGLGWRVYSDPPILFDHATYHPGSMGEIGRVRIDGFEDADLKEYDGPASGGFQSAEPAAALFGDYGLEMDDAGSIFSVPGDGLDNYIRDGVPIEAFFNPKDSAGETYVIYLCPDGNHGSTDYTYKLEFQMDIAEKMRIRKDHGGNEWTLHGSGTNELHYATTDAVDWSTQWYRVEILIDQSQPLIRADLYDYSSGEFIAYVEQDEDSEFMDTENGFGFGCSNQGNWFVDELRELE